MLGAVNWETGGHKNIHIISLLKQTEAQKHFLNPSSHLEGRDAGVGAILVDLVHGSLQSDSLLGEILQVL